MEHIVYISAPESNKIYVWKMNSAGTLIPLQIIDTPGQANPMVINPFNTHLYVGIRPNFSIATYRILKNGLLTQIGITPITSRLTHLAISFQGDTLYSTSYSGNCLNISSINNQGIVDVPYQILEGLISCHSTNIDISNKTIWVPCLQENCIRLYEINKLGFLMPKIPALINITNGNGPRHMAFHCNGDYAYVINELSSTVNVIFINNSNFNPKIIQTVNVIPITFSNIGWASDIHITPNGRWLYCCDRAVNIISGFAVSKDGSTLNALDHYITEAQPRSFSIDSEGKFLVLAGQKSHHVVVYSIDNNSGKLTPLARYAVANGPSWVSILTCNI